MFYFLKLILKIKATSVIKNPHHISYFLKPNRLYHYHYHTYGFVKKRRRKEHEELCCVEEGTANRNPLTLRNPRRHCSLLLRTLSNSLSLNSL